MDGAFVWACWALSSPKLRVLARAVLEAALSDAELGELGLVGMGINPIVTSQYSSTTLYQVPYHI